MMYVYGLQYDIAWENKPANFQKVRSWLQKETIAQGSLVVLPEMFATGFSMNKEQIAQDEPLLTLSFLQEMAREFSVYILGGVVALGDDGRGQNMVIACNDNGEEIARYQKIHPFTYGGETEHYQPGKDLSLFTWQGFTVAPFICYDLRFPEVFRHALQLGASLYTISSCWPAAREAHWVKLLQARAIENQAYVVGVNRCGNDPTLAYSGRSLIVDPKGEILADGGNNECIINAEISLDELNEYRDQFPAINDIRKQYLIKP